MDNPFAVLTAVVAPAILTNACSVLSLGTANRIARVVDRTRLVTASRAALPVGSHDYQGYSLQLQRLAIRGNFLLRALRAFYAALGAFAASALMAVAGSALVAYDVEVAFQAIAAIGFIIGSFGVISLVTGSVMMVRETRVAIRSMAEEVEFVRSQERIGDPTPPHAPAS